ncbi:MAG: hypothetical protein F2531_00095 [Actinobacteria bacterium]|uniref:Unannotated protein n=1 Tax=freshwater metagenome TaxID=449393 RepID=A0A6J6B843_9ZZZZ|nr:hypothetical protein [Actinomycetota bacterium]
MAEPYRYAITAISDAQDEGFIAASLERQGWQVLYRALTADQLSNFLDTLDAEQVTIFTTSDFVSGATNYLRKLKPSINEIRLSAIPANDHDFSEMIRASTKEATLTWSAIPTVPIVTLSSFGRSVGTSTIALNIASELAMQGSRVLLIDAHARSAFLSPYLQIFGVNREVLRSPFGFSIFEAHSAENFATLEENIAQYEILLIDIGEVWQPARAISGNRSEDYPFIWAAHYSTEMITISSSEGSAISEVRNSLRGLKELAIKPKITHLINNVRNHSIKERTTQQKIISDELHCRSIFLSRDDRALSRAKAASSTLAQSAPKSALRGEIARYCRESNWGLS